jgi:CheY-like chemotaxis protein
MGMTKTILVVEDNDSLREAFCEILRDQGYDVVPAAHGQEALDHLHDDPGVSLIFLDLNMPVMDGRRFRQIQLEDPALSSIPVIILTATAREDNEAKQIGVVDWLKKPAAVGRLIELTRAYA